MDLGRLSESKYYKESSRPDSRLRILLAHSTFHASILDHRDDTGDSTYGMEEREQNYNRIAGSSKSLEEISNRTLSNSDSVADWTRDIDDVQSDSGSDDSYDSENDDDDDLIIDLMQAISEPTTTVSVLESDWDEDEDELDALDLSAITPSHSKPELTKKPITYQLVTPPPTPPASPSAPKETEQDSTSSLSKIATLSVSTTELERETTCPEDETISDHPPQQISSSTPQDNEQISPSLPLEPQQPVYPSTKALQLEIPCHKPLCTLVQLSNRRKLISLAMYPRRIFTIADATLVQICNQFPTFASIYHLMAGIGQYISVP
ncbi:hypothetical protein MMC12_002159 [Toensbergia leucococca]|nr:hypothetical protein [Toensbergia leucococca]